MWYRFPVSREEDEPCEIRVKYNEHPLESLTFDANKVLVVYGERSNAFYEPIVSIATAVQLEAYEWSRQVFSHGFVKLNCCFSRNDQVFV